MNFLSMMAHKLTDKFNPDSSGFGGSGVIGNIMHGDGGMVGNIMGQPQQAAPGIADADATHGQDSMARNHGFQNYDQMLAWAKQREMHRPVQTVGREGAAEPGTAANPTIMGTNPMAMHPKNMFEWITSAINRATGQ